MSAWESAPPFILITIMISAMGGLPALVHKMAYGKPKAVGLDSWDRKLLKRDAAVEAYYKKLAEQKK
jgi:NADH-ubiquinone oxidoreductase MWFE subunit